MRIGFTGTRRGMDSHQKWEVAILVAENKPTEVHHGDCIGADTDFHEICMEHIPIVIHPSNLKTRAWNYAGVTMEHEPKPPIVRDHDIVDSVDMLIACPAQNYEILWSGTWATIRYARKVGKLVRIIYPGTQSGNGSGRSV